jgi:hypothetical protein
MKWRNTYIHSYIHTYIHKCIHVYIYIFTCIHTFIYIHTYIRTYLHTSTCIHICMHSYIYTYIHTFGRVCNNPQWARAPSFTRFLDHTRRTTVGRSPLDEWSARRRDIYLTTHNTHNRRPCPPGGIRTRDLSRRAAADLRLRPRGHWDRDIHTYTYTCTYIHTQYIHTYVSVFVLNW